MKNVKYGVCEYNIPELSLIQQDGGVSSPILYNYYDSNLPRWWIPHKDCVIYTIPEGCIVMGCISYRSPQSDKLMKKIEKELNVEGIFESRIFLDAYNPTRKAWEKADFVYKGMKNDYMASGVLLNLFPISVVYRGEDVPKSLFQIINPKLLKLPSL